MTSHVGTEPYPLGLPLTSLCDLSLLFVYFQVNNVVLYFLDYVDDICIMVLSALVSILIPNHTYRYVFTTSINRTVYSVMPCSGFVFAAFDPT